MEHGAKGRGQDNRGRVFALPPSFFELRRTGRTTEDKPSCAGQAAGFKVSDSKFNVAAGAAFKRLWELFMVIFNIVKSPLSVMANPKSSRPVKAKKFVLISSGKSGTLNLEA
jgi:hypothetical protein